MPDVMSYVYLWEYRVAPDRLAAFLEDYGPDGAWVRLFHRAPGYVDTVLLRDRSDPHRFVTIDRWESYEAWTAFRHDFAAEFAVLDARGEGWTVSETEIGRFTSAP